MKKLSTSILVVLTILLLSVGCSKESKPKYLFYFIGDGMGLNITHATECYLAAQRGLGYSVDSLTYSYFPVLGSINTYSSNSHITDSAAAGTALACGEKTTQGTIGMDSTHTKELKSVAIKAKESGMGVAVMSSVSIDHATPAAFYAHNPKRSNYYEIALDGAVSNIDFLGGSGFCNVDGDKSGKNVYDAYADNGYTRFKGLNEIQNVVNCKSKVLVTERDGVSASSFAYKVDRTDKDLALKDLVKSATDYLYSNFKEEGFFLMAEGGMIDWAAHSNDANCAIGEVLDLNEAIEVAYQFYLAHPDETLIVVTSDHETGGYGNGVSGYSLDYKRLLGGLPSIDSYAAEVVESKATSFKDVPMPGGFKFTDAEMSTLEKIYNDLKRDHKILGDKTAMYQKTNSAFASAVYRLINNAIGAGWTTNSHTGSPVMVYSVGCCSEEFAGHKDNTELPQIMNVLLGL